MKIKSKVIKRVLINKSRNQKKNGKSEEKQK